ncbi:hypothetical protein KDA11_06935, partial [Candidatus Saccharibacteria bacterium]|nr:hypothetical protein [Candidatus Saccharibacteria bacterium]
MENSSRIPSLWWLLARFSGLDDNPPTLIHPITTRSVEIIVGPDPNKPTEFYRPLTYEVTEGDIIRAEKIKCYLQEENDSLRTMLRLEVDAVVGPKQDTRFVKINARKLDAYCPDDYDIDTLEVVYDKGMSNPVHYYNVLAVQVTHWFMSFGKGPERMVLIRDCENKKIRNRQRMLRVKNHTSACIRLEMENAKLRQ